MNSVTEGSSLRDPAYMLDQRRVAFADPAMAATIHPYFKHDKPILCIGHLPD